jgi:hypothetical protein
MDELLCEQDPSRLRDRDRRSPKVRLEQAPELAFADPKPLGECFDISRVERTIFDQRKSP